MSLKTWAFAFGLAAASLSAPLARAADQQDGPAVTADPSTDIGDLFAWMDSGALNLNMVMTVFPSADKATSKYSSTALYVFHMMAKASFSDTGVYPEVTVVCSFSNAATQVVQCWAGDGEYATGAVGATITSASGKLKVFTGPRNDPFFFNLAAFNNAAMTIKTTVSAATRDVAGCPTVTPAQTAAIKTALSTPAADSFAGKNTLAIVVTVDKTLVATPQRQTITVYGSTNKPVP